MYKVAIIKNAKPIHVLVLIFSLRTKEENIIVNKTLNLSIGTTTLTWP